MKLKLKHNLLKNHQNLFYNLFSKNILMNLKKANNL